MNTVKLIGNVGRDLSIKAIGDNKVASFTIATNENYINRNNVEIKNTNWHNVVAWGKTAELCEELIAKGKFVSIEGKLQNRSYEDKNNKKIYITEVVAYKVSEVDSKPKQKTFFL